MNVSLSPELGTRKRVLCLAAAGRPRGLPAAAHPHRLHGFTLIELLVVITIIVVLLALLVPAMDKAIYQATLLQCSTQMRAVGQGATFYAVDNKRQHMDRMAYRQSTFPYGLKAPVAFAAADGQTAMDDRLIHRGYVDMEWLVDPLSETVDLELDTNPNEAIYSNYLMYYGFGYDGEKAMKRIGDRWTFNETKGHPAGRSARFAFPWLLTDLDIIFEGAHASAGHPDKAGVLTPASAQGGDFDYGSDQNQLLYGSFKVTYSFWRNTGNHQRGLMDLNFAGEDGAVIRLTDVERVYDDRVAHVANVGTRASYAARYVNIAKP